MWIRSNFLWQNQFSLKNNSNNLKNKTCSLHHICYFYSEPEFSKRHALIWIKYLYGILLHCLIRVILHNLMGPYRVFKNRYSIFKKFKLYSDIFAFLYRKLLSEIKFLKPYEFLRVCIQGLNLSLLS